MRSYVQFLTTPTADTPGTTLLLHFDCKRYLLGHISEGTSRACMQQGIKLWRVSDIFLTGKIAWSNTGGLTGMIMSLADATTEKRLAVAAAEAAKQERKMQQQKNGQDQSAARGTSEPSTRGATLTIHGGANLTHSLATARRFVFRKGMPVLTNEYEAREENDDLKPTWSDENIMVWAMPIHPSGSSSTYDGDAPAAVADAAANRKSSPRKRSWDEFEHDGAHDRSEDDRDICKEVVHRMFGSDWRMDKMIEVPLHEAKPGVPAFQRNKETNKIHRYRGPMPGSGEPLPNITVLQRLPWPGTSVGTLPPTQPSKVSLSYIIKTYPQRGRFDPKKATELGVEIPQRSILAGGNNVQTADGRTITPDMVLGEMRPGNGFALIDLPSVEYVPNLVARREWNDPDVMRGLGYIIWILGPGVSRDELLLKFCRNMKSVKHLVSSPDHCPNYLAFSSAARSAVQLNRIDPKRFPVPVHDNVTLPQPGFGNPNPSLRELRPFAPAKMGLMIILSPKEKLDTSNVIEFLNTAKVIQDIPAEVIHLAQKAKDEFNNPEERKKIDDSQIDMPSKDAELITLGTGSALPSKYRNVSSSLVRIPGCGSFLFDCGENTLGQLKRVFTPDKLKEVLRDLKMIWISHLHADHHLGTTTVIKAWYNANYENELGDKLDTDRDHSSILSSLRSGTEKRLAVVSGIHMIKFLCEYSSVENFGFDKVIPLSVSPKREAVPMPPSTSLSWDGQIIEPADILPYFNIAALHATPVVHCHGAFAVTVLFSTGLKVAYSGDCRPSLPFARHPLSQDAHLLIHEATFDDELRDDALAKRHSTTSEALEVAWEMHNNRTILTHFSQRYQKIPELSTVNFKAEKWREEEEENAEIEVETWVEEVDNMAAKTAVDAAKEVESLQSSSSSSFQALSSELVRRKSEAGGMRPPWLRNMKDDFKSVSGSGTNSPSVSSVVSASGVSSPVRRLRATSTRIKSPSSGNSSRDCEKWDMRVADYSTSVITSKVDTDDASNDTNVDEEERDLKVGVAFDYMKVKLGDIAELEKLSPALMRLFEKAEE